MIGRQRHRFEIWRSLLSDDQCPNGLEFAVARDSTTQAWKHRCAKLLRHSHRQSPPLHRILREKLPVTLLDTIIIHHRHDVLTTLEMFSLIYKWYYPLFTKRTWTNLCDLHFYVPWCSSRQLPVKIKWLWAFFKYLTWWHKSWFCCEYPWKRCSSVVFSFLFRLT